MFKPVRHLFKCLFLMLAYFAFANAFAVTMDFDLPDPRLPFWAPYPLTTGTGDWTAVPVTIGRQVGDAASFIVTPGDPLDPNGRIYGPANMTLGVDYDISPGEPVPFVTGENGPVKGRFYFRARRTTPLAEGGEKPIILTSPTGASRKQLTVTCIGTNTGAGWFQTSDLIILAGTTDSKTMWFHNVARLPTTPTAPLVVTYGWAEGFEPPPELITFPASITGVSPYGPTTEMSALPKAGGTAMPVYGNAYLPIPIMPSPDAQNGDFTAIKITAIKLGEDNIDITNSLPAYIYFVDRLLIFDSVKKYAGPKADVFEGDVYSIGFTISKPFDKPTIINFMQDPGTERDANPSAVNGVPTAHPDFIGDSTDSGIIIFNNGDRDSPGVLMIPGQQSGRLIVKTVNNGWFDPYRILRVVPQDFLITPTYLVNPNFELTIKNLGLWPKAAFEKTKITLPPGTLTGTLSFIVNEIAATPYEPTVSFAASGSSSGTDGWTKRGTQVFPAGTRVVTREISVPNATGRDLWVQYRISKVQNATLGNRQTCTVTVLGLPSKVAMVTQPVASVKEGQSYTVTLELDQVRSHDLMFPLEVLTPTTPGIPAVEGVDFTIPASVTIKAGQKRASFKIQTAKTYDPVTDIPKPLKIGFSSMLPPNVSWVGNISPSVTVGIRQLVLVPPNGLYFPSKKIMNEIGLENRMSVCFPNGTEGKVKLSSNQNQEGGRQIEFGIVQSDGSYLWRPFMDLDSVGRDPVPFIYRVTNGYNYGGNFKIKLIGESGSYRSVLNIKAVDRRPNLKLKRYNYIAPTASKTLDPLADAQNCAGFATSAQLLKAYELDDTYQPDTVHTQKAPDGGGLTNLPTLSTGGDSAYIELSGVGLTDTSTYGQVRFVYGGESLTNNPFYDNEVSASELLFTLGGPGLRRAPGFKLVTGTAVRSVWGTYLDPYASYKNSEKPKKASFGIKKDRTSGNPYAFCRSNVKLYSQKDINYYRRSGIYSDFVPQVQTIPLSIGYSDLDSGKVETNIKYFMYRPVIDDMQTWGDDSYPAPPVTEDWLLPEPSTMSFRTICHPGSIIRVTGRYFGDKPKVTVESAAGASTVVNSSNIISAPCTILSRQEITVNGVLQEALLVRLPTSMPSGWIFDTSDVLQPASSRTRLIINSGTGLTGGQIILKPFTAGNDYDNEYPTAYRNLDSPIAVGSLNVNPYLEIPITMESYQSTYFKRGYLSNDRNSDELIVSRVWMENVSYLRGSAKIVRKGNAYSIRFTPDRNTVANMPNQGIRIFFEVKERWGGRAGLSMIGAFLLEYEP